MNYSSSLPVIVDMQIAVQMNPLQNPTKVINRTASKMLEHGVTLPPGLGSSMLISLAQSERAWEALSAGIEKLKAQGMTI